MRQRARVRVIKMESFCGGRGVGVDAGLKFVCRELLLLSMLLLMLLLLHNGTANNNLGLHLLNFIYNFLSIFAPCSVSDPWELCFVFKCLLLWGRSCTSANNIQYCKSKHIATYIYILIIAYPNSSSSLSFFTRHLM